MAARIPKLVKGVAGGDLRGLPLAPVDGFILSRIDGALSVPEIAAGTGLDEAAVLATVAKLEALGIVENASMGRSSVVPRSPSSPSVHVTVPRRTSNTAEPARGAAQARSAGATPAAAQARNAGATPQITSPQRLSSPPAARAPAAAAPPSPPSDPQRSRLDAPNQKPLRYDPRELDEDADLEMPQRRRVLDLYYSLGELNYYAVLGVPRNADKKAIKRAYFELASLFHPDKFFRKRLGSFKGKMEAIFGRITEAHDILTSKEQRPEYDTYLGAQAQSRGIEELMESAMAEVARAAEELKRTVKPSATPPSMPSVRPSARGSVPDTDPQILRDALARRLIGGAAIPAASPSRPPPKMPGMSFSSSQDAVDALRRRYEDRLTDAHVSQAKKYIETGRAAEAKKDMVTAATSYRVALSFTPNDPELRAAHDRTQREADAVLAESYLKQAMFEERSQHWPEAAKSWGRLARARPSDARAHERHANALVHDGGNLHEAASAAKSAVALEPGNAAYKATLAAVYQAAGLTLNAKRELEAALQIEPNNETIQAFLKRLQHAG